MENVRDIARALKAANVKCVLWAGGGDLSLSYGHDAALTEAGLRRIIDAGKEFGLPVGINGTRDFKDRYAQGVRLFFDVGPAFAGGGPSLMHRFRRSHASSIASRPPDHPHHLRRSPVGRPYRPKR